MDSIIAPIVASFASNVQYDIEDVVTYDDLIEDELKAIAKAIEENQ
jgi:hypothetical protein